MVRINGRRAETGFSLLELVIVLAIISIATTIAITSYYSQIEAIRIKGDTRSMEQAIQLARMHAITKNVPHGVVFDRDERWYFTFMDNAPAPNGDRRFTDTDTVLSNNVLPGSTTNDYVLETRGISGRFFPNRLDSRNQFTCIIGNPTYTWGRETIVFDPMGRITYVDPSGAVKSVETGNLSNSDSFIMIQRMPDGSAGDQIKNRGWVHIDIMTGIPETLLSQEWSTLESNWCSK